MEELRSAISLLVQSGGQTHALPSTYSQHNFARDTHDKLLLTLELESIERYTWWMCKYLYVAYIQLILNSFLKTYNWH